MERKKNIEQQERVRERDRENYSHECSPGNVEIANRFIIQRDTKAKTQELLAKMVKINKNRFTPLANYPLKRSLNGF